MQNQSHILKMKAIHKSFGGIRALEDVDAEVSHGEILGLIGPNGAGKTTLFNIISGIYPPDNGKITFNNKAITRLPAHKIAAAGISRTFQNIRLFEEMTVLENVMVGRHPRTKCGFLSAMLKLPAERAEEKNIIARSMQILEDVGLADRAGESAKNLPFGRMRVLEIARALATEPSLILLDEPAAGLNQRETETLAQLICALQDKGITVVVVEHDMDLVMSVSERVIVLNQGKKIAEGLPREIQNHPEVITAYLGEHRLLEPSQPEKGSA